jgi:hypothetical protein
MKISNKVHLLAVRRLLELLEYDKGGVNESIDTVFDAFLIRLVHRRSYFGDALFPAEVSVLIKR